MNIDDFFADDRVTPMCDFATDGSPFGDDMCEYEAIFGVKYSNTGKIFMFACAKHSRVFAKECLERLNQ